MSLTNDQALKAVKNPPNKSQVLEGRKYQSRLRILTEAYSREGINHESAWIELKTYLANTLTTDKYNAIIKYFTFPLSIVNISNDIMTDLYTVFNGRNASFSVQYPNDRLKEIAEQQLSELNVRGWIEEKGKQVLKSAPNSVTVIDIDDSGNTVLLLIPNEKLLGYDFERDGTFKFVIFLHSEGVDENGTKWRREALYDDEFYRVYLVVNGTYTLEVENPHSLGYCPARFFYDKPLLNKHVFDRSVPLANARGQMLKWTIFEEFLWYADQYGSFPAMEYADNGCDVTGCNGGIIDGYPILDDDGKITSHVLPKECPSCATKGLIGPGTAVGITVSEDADVQDTRGVLKFVTPDVSSLEYVVKRQQAREGFIKQNTVGFNSVTTASAVNEAQIRLLAESKSKAPREISTHLSNLWVWIIETHNLLINDVQVRASGNFGTEFLVLSEKDITTLIQEAKKAGTQSAEIAELNHMLAQTKYKSDPFKAQFMRISADLEPSAFDTREELEKKFAAGMITREDYYMALNFNDLITQFELDNGSIVAFGKELSYSEKIKRIKNTLLFYTNQKIGSNEQDSTEQATVSPTGASDN